MTNLVFGITLAVLCVIGYYISWRMHSKHQYTWALILVVVCGLLLRMFVTADLYLHAWDERYHALVAKNMMSHPFLPTLYENPVLPFNYKEWSANHIWLHKQPFPLWSMALSMKIFGVNEIALRLPSVILSTLGIPAIYSIGKNLFNRKTAFVAAILFSAHGFLIEITGGRTATDHIDLFFLCFVLFSVFFAVRFIKTHKQVFNLLSGICLGLAILSKWLPALIVLPVYLLLMLDSGRFRIKEIIRNILFCTLLAAVVAVPWQIYVLANFPAEAKWEYAYNRLHITESLNGLDLPFWYHVDHLQIKFGIVALIAYIWYIRKTVKRPRNYKRIALVIWILIPLLFFSFVKTKMQGYLMFTAPAVLLITALFFQYLWLYRKRFRYKYVPLVIIFLLFFFPLWKTVERTKMFSTRERHPEWTKEIKGMREHAGMKPLIIFNTDRPIETMFYIDCTAYPFIPEKGVPDSLEQHGYKVILLKQNDNNPEL